MNEQRFHVFLSHSSRDDAAALSIAQALRKEGVKVWLDKWKLVPGDTWQERIETALENSDAFAILVGSEITNWQRQEMDIAIDRHVKMPKNFRVIPVLLPEADKDKLPARLSGKSWVDFSSIVDAKALYLLKCGIYGVQPDGVPMEGVIEPPADKRAPYKGLRSFDMGDAAFFFGREELTAAIENRIIDLSTRRGNLRLITIYGRSGSGKSSVAKAGVLGNLTKHGAHESEWTAVQLMPGADPLRSLALALAYAFGTDQTFAAIDYMVQRFKEEPATFDRALDASLRAAGGNRRVVVLVDQFEECFTLCEDRAARTAFIANLTYAAKSDSGNAVILTTVRVEDLGSCVDYPDLVISLSDLAFVVAPMTGETDLRRAIEAPALHANAAVAPALTNMLLEDIKDEPGVLPLLQYTLEQLWTHRTSDTLTVELYQSLGRVGGLLRNQAEKTLRYFSKKELPVCRHVFLNLVQEVCGGSRYVRHRLQLQSLVTKRFQMSALLPVIRALAAENARLLTIRKGHQSGDRIVEIAHEELIRSWPRLRSWLRKDRKFRQWCGRLESSREQWEHAKRDKSALLAGRLLGEAQGWIKRKADRLNEKQTEYIRLSVAHRRMQRLARIAAAAAVVMLAISGVVIYQLRLRDGRSRDLARRAIDEIRNYSDKPVPASVALHAIQQAPTREAEEALHLAVQFGATAIEGHTKGVDAIAYSREGKYLVTGGSDGALSVWDVETGNRVHSRMCHAGGAAEASECPEAPAVAVDFGADQSAVVSATRAGTVRIWRDHKQAAAFEGGADLTKVLYHEDSQRIFATSASGFLRAWNTAELQTPPVVLLKGSSFTALAASPDWKRLAVGSSGGAVTLIDPAANAQPPPVQMCTPAGRVNDLRFSGDGNYLGVACQTGVAVVWDVKQNKVAVDLSTGERADALFGIALSADAAQVVTLTRMADAVVWDRATGRDILTLRSPDTDDNKFRALAFGPARCAGYVQPLAIACANGRVRIYDLDLQSLVRQAETIASRRTFTPDECRRIFDAATCTSVPARRFGLLGG